jgi:orotate phosphoribosyltransferase
VCAIARLTDLLDFLAASSGQDMADHLARVKAYRERYGVT